MSVEGSPGLFLHVASELLRSLPQLSLRFVMVGGGVLLEPIKELAQALGIDHAVKFRGHVDHERVGRELEAMDVYLAPRLGETFGMALVEALSHGLPVVGCSCGAYSEIVSNGTSGLILPCHEGGKEDGNGVVLTLAGALRRLLLDPSERRTLGIVARERAKLRFGVLRYVELYSSFYGSLWLRHGLGG